MTCRRFSNPLFVALGFCVLILSFMTGCGGGTDGVRSDPETPPPQTEAPDENEAEDPDENETEDPDENELPDDPQDDETNSGANTDATLGLR